MDNKRKKIRFGLSAIKGLGEETVYVIIAERNRNGRFKSLQDFAKRVPAKLMNKKTLEALAFSGAFDEFGDRKAIVDSLDDLSRFAREHEQQVKSGQMGLFGGMDEEAIEFMLKDTKATKEDILRWERESLGLFVSDHPLKGLGRYFEKYGHLIGRLNREDDVKKKRTLHGIITTLRKITTKNGKNMIIFELEDTSGKINAVIFPTVYKKIPVNKLEKDVFVRIRGRIEERDGVLNCIVDELKIGNLNDVQNLVFFSDEEDIKKTTTYTIEIPPKTTKAQVDVIKKMLMKVKSENPHDKKVRIKIQGKTILLPFTIRYSDELKREIDNVLKKHKRK